MKLPKSRNAARLLVIAWTLLIFATIPVARRVQALIEGMTGRYAFTVIVLTALAAGAVCALLRLARFAPRARAAASACLIGLAAVYAAWTIKLSSNPEESLHFVEYGVLSALIFHLLSFSTRNVSIYPLAFLCGSVIGTVDEVLQWLTPNRVFDFRDVRLNAAAVLLVQIGIASVWRPSLPVPRIDTRSLRRLCLAAGAQIVLLTLCLNVTPPVAAWLSSNVPALTHLAAKDSVMSEYGYRHRDQKVGVFYSRFSLEELREIDRSRAAEVGALLQSTHAVPYEEFLARYTPLADPFVHELRVHLFRRNEHLRLAAAEQFAKGEHCTVALHENRLLERCFARTLQRSGYRLSGAQRSRLKQCAETDTTYTSSVSANLIVWFGLTGVWIGCTVMVIGIALLGVRAKS